MNFQIKALVGMALASALTVASPASAAVTVYADNPSGNSSDFASDAGGSVDTNYDGENATTGGTLDQGNFTETTGAGPGQGNGSSTPLSTGEGLYGGGTHLLSAPQQGMLAFTFDGFVSGVGLTVIDLFNPNGVNDIVLSIYDGVNGTGNLIGSVSAADFNFQQNYTYFMGISSSNNDIRSFVLSNPYGAADIFGVDNIVSYSTTGAVPEPSTWMMLLLAFGALGAIMRSPARKRRLVNA